MPGFDHVIIVGAGPAGLLLALLLARKGISVEVLEQGLDFDKRPRATHYSAPAVYELRRAGVLPDVLAAGFIPRNVCWRKLDGTCLASLYGSAPLDGTEDRMTCLPLLQLSICIYKHLSQHENAVVRWGHRLVGMGEEEGKAWVDVEVEAKGTKRLRADYVIGCDGASSMVRQCLFGERNFPGKTWDEQVVATNIYYDFDKFDYEDSQFIIHPEHWYMAARIANDGLWRVTYGEIPGLSHDEIVARQPMKFEAFLPGHPKPDEYKIVNFSPYRVHQRLAEKMRVGRFLLVADAAHLCNPFGGLGLTGGIVDAGGLYDCLVGIWEGKADDSILDIYSDVRRAKWTDIVDPISSANFRRLFDQDPETAIEDDEFLKLCKRAETDPEFSRTFQMGMNVLQYDFTQHYRNAPK